MNRSRRTHPPCSPLDAPPWGAATWIGPGLIVFLLFLLLQPDSHGAGAVRSDLAAEAAASIGQEATHVERELAVSVLAGLGDAALPEVERLASDHRVFRRLAAVQVLASQRRGAERFLPFLHDRGYTVRAAALHGIKNATTRLNDISPILPLLHDPFWPVRRAAVLALTASGLPGAAEPVLRALGDPEPEVRRIALHFMDELDADLSAALLRETAASLTSAELSRFLKSCLPLARPANEAFFREMIEKHDLSPPGLAALQALVAADDSGGGLDDIVCRFPRLVALSMAREREVADVADRLIGRLGHRAPDELARLLEEEIFSGQHPPDQVVHLLVSALGRGSIPVLARWCRAHLGKKEIVASCLSHLDRGGFPEGAEALAAIFPLLEGELRDQVVKQAAVFTGQAEHPPLVSLLSDVAFSGREEPARKKAFAALCRLRDPPQDLVRNLCTRFLDEEEPGMRGVLAVLLADAARGANRSIVISSLLDEIVSAGPAAIRAGEALSQIAAPDHAADATAALCSLYRLRRDAEERERILLALIRIDEPEIDGFIAKEVEKQWKEIDSQWIVRLAAALGGASGSSTGALLRRMALDSNILLQKRALQALMKRRDPSSIELLERSFPAFTSHARATLLKEIKGSGLESEAADFITRIIRTENDSQILTAAIEALSPDRAADVKSRLMELAAASFDLGRGVAEEAIRTLVRSRDAEAVWILRSRLSRFLEANRSGQSAFLGGSEENQALALFTAQALAEQCDPDTPPLLAGLLFQDSRAGRKRAILGAWHAEAGGPVHVEKHHWSANLMEAFLHYPDSIIEKAVADEIRALEKSGEIFKMGDAVFGILCRGLLQAGRCPEISAALASLTFRCRPDMSPAEFRLCVTLGDRAALGDKPGEAASFYRLAHFVLNYYPPSRIVVRQELGDADPFIGYDPISSICSEALSLEAGVLLDRGKKEEAARLLERARRRSPFRRQRE